MRRHDFRNLTRALVATLAGASITAAAATTTRVLRDAATIASADSLVLDVQTTDVNLDLAFDARMEATAWSGSAFSLRIVVNGTPLGSERLANKPNVFGTPAKRLFTWGDAERWRLVYSPDFEPRRNAPGSQHQVLGSAPFQFTLRLDGVLRPGANRIVLRHVDPRLPAIVMRAVRLEPQRRTRRAVAPPITASGAVDTTFAFDVLPGGGIAIASGGLRTRLDTEVSIPRGGWRHLGRDARGWDDLATTADGVHGSALDVVLERRIRRAGRALEIRDTFVNRTTVDLGLIVKLRLNCDVTPATAILAGMPLPPEPRDLVSSEPQAPSAVAITPAGAVGLLPANDVAWIHAESFRDSLGIGLSDASLCIPARDSVELAWWVIPCAGGAYRDWIDVARARLQVDHTVQGGFAFGSFEMLAWPSERLRDWVRLRGLRYVSSPGPTASGSHGLHGPALLGSLGAQDSLKAFATAMHAAAPDVQVLAYFHAFLVNADFGIESYEKQRLCVADGSPLSYPRSSSQPQYELVVPVPGSAFAADLERVLGRLWDLGFDGIYWDEMAWSSRVWTYGSDWDGVSGEVDPRSHLLVRRKSAIPLLVQPWVTAQLAMIERRGKVVVANTLATTRTMQRYAFPRFVETAVTANLALAHLGSPVGLGDRLRQRDAAGIARGIHAHLERGALYYYYAPQATLTQPNLTAHMFPFTPQRLRDGTLWGEERILTSRSGRFGWDDLSSHTVHVFDAAGNEVEGKAQTEVEGGARWTDVQLEPGWTAAIVRGPRP